MPLFLRLLASPLPRPLAIFSLFPLPVALAPCRPHADSTQYGMGHGGYAGLRTLGNVPITVAGRTMSHPAMINEEMHFDVVLGRTWVEKMNVK